MESLAAAAVLAGAGGSTVALTVTRSAQLRRRRVRGGAQGLIGQVGVVRNWSERDGSVTLAGAVWRARRSPSPDEEPERELHAGDPVVVERLTGLTLSVRPAEEWELL
jgi:membrane protein implicated in regulation of membrane protease activity